MRSLYLNGNFGSSGGTDGGASMAVNLLNASNAVINPATSDTQALQLTQETASAANLAIIASTGATAADQVTGNGYLASLASAVVDGGVLIASPLPQGTNNIGITTQNGTPTPVVTTSLQSAFVLKSSSGTHLSTSVQIDATAPSATYYVQMVKGSASCPPDGAVTFLHAPITVVHVLNTPNTVVFNDSGSPAPFTTGLCVDLSSTQFTKTSTGLTYLLVDGSVL
jgi:hypothetical protein